jgi:hypothetical protein
MKTILLTVVLPALILFFFLNLAAREMFLWLHEKKRRAEREDALAESLRLDFTRESATLKRVEVENPEARILCVDDEEIILDVFRKILVLDGYCVDTVETGQEALGLVQTRNYDFVDVRDRCGQIRQTSAPGYRRRYHHGIRQRGIRRGVHEVRRDGLHRETVLRE